MPSTEDAKGSRISSIALQQVREASQRPSGRGTVYDIERLSAWKRTLWGKLGSTGYRKGIFGPPHVRDDGELDPALCGRCREIFKYLIDEPEDSLLQGMNPEWYHSGFRFDTRWELVFVPGEDKEWSLLEVGRNWTAAPVRWSRRPGLYVTAYRSPENSFVQMTLSAAKPVDKRDAPDWDVPEEATVEEVPSVDNGKALGRKGWW